jgi:hypothetical protein
MAPKRILPPIVGRKRMLFVPVKKTPARKLPIKSGTLMTQGKRLLGFFMAWAICIGALALYLGGQADCGFVKLKKLFCFAAFFAIHFS